MAALLGTHACLAEAQTVAANQPVADPSGVSSGLSQAPLPVQASRQSYNPEAFSLSDTILDLFNGLEGSARGLQEAGVYWGNNELGFSIDTGKMGLPGSSFKASVERRSQEEGGLVAAGRFVVTF